MKFELSLMPLLLVAQGFRRYDGRLVNYYFEVIVAAA